jgi:hypothetical protein
MKSLIYVLLKNRYKNILVDNHMDICIVPSALEIEEGGKI